MITCKDSAVTDTDQVEEGSMFQFYKMQNTGPMTGCQDEGFLCDACL